MPRPPHPKTRATATKKPRDVQQATATPEPKTKRLRHGLQVSLPLAAIGGLALAAGQAQPTDITTASTPPPAVASTVAAAPSSAPTPLMAKGAPVNWWFAYKFSAQTYPLNPQDPARRCPFGGTLRRDATSSGLRYAVANSNAPALVDGSGLIGTSDGDPLGATFGEIYNGNYYFVTWNDQFYNDPPRHDSACDNKQCGKPWGHSKGIVAWDANGNGILLQVTTPSWPGAGSGRVPRADGNTLGCISDDNDTGNAQDFFALRLNHDDLKTVLHALAVASVSTDISNPQIVNRRVNGALSPNDIDQLVAALGHVSADKTWLDQPLSSGVRLIVKPSALHVPPWQFVSSILGGENLLTATWWANPKIASTRSAADVHCWDATLSTPPGEVDVALTGTWDGTQLHFTGGPNHAKIGASLSGTHPYAIFGDLNQQGQLGDASAPNGANCDSSQNGRGGMFFVIENPALAKSIATMISGTRAGYPN